MGSKSKSSSGGGGKQRYANPLERAGNPFERQGNVVVNTGVVNPNRNTQRYDNPFERQANQQADETLISAAAEKLKKSNPQGNFNTGAGSDIRNELVRMRNKNYQRSNPEELKLANATNLGQTNVGSNQYFTAQQPTFAEVRGDVRTRLNQDAQNYGTGIMGAALSAATGIPGLGLLLNQSNQNTSPDGYRFIPNQQSDPFNITLKDKPPIPFYIDKILRDLNNSSSTGTGQSMVEDLNSRIPPSIGTGQSMVEDLNSRIPPISEDTSYVDKILKDLTLSNSSRPTNAATGDTLNFVDPFTGTGRSKIDSSTGQSMVEDTSYVDKILRDLTLNNSSRPTNAATGDISSIPFRPTLPATEGSYTYPQMFKGEEEPFRDANERIADTIGIPFDSRENQRNNIIEEYFEGTEDIPPTFDPNDPFANLASEYLPILTSFRNAGYNESDIIDIFRKRNFLAFGGSVAPQSGPMSNGIGTLYNTR